MALLIYNDNVYFRCEFKWITNKNVVMSSFISLCAGFTIASLPPPLNNAPALLPGNIQFQKEDRRK
jgi:hypothetical protein